MQRGSQNQAYAAALETLTPFAFQGSSQGRFVKGWEIEQVRFHNVVFQNDFSFSVTIRIQSESRLRQWVKT